MTTFALTTTIPAPVDSGCCGVSSGSALSEPDAETYATWFKALSDPTRIRILNLLAGSDEAIYVCEIVEQFPLGQPAISHHLRVLRDARFVSAERRGTFVYYQVNRACFLAFPDAARHIMAG